MNLKVTVITFAFLFFCSPTLSMAQTPSPSPSGILNAVKEKVSEELAQIKQTAVRKAYVGTVSAKNDLTLIITNLQNKSRTATLVTDAIIKLAKGKDGTVADVKVGDFVIAMGDADGSGVLTVKRLLVITKPTTADTREAKFVTVTKAATTAITTDTMIYKVVSTTKFSDKTTVTDIKEGDKLVIITNGANLQFVHKF